MVGIAAGTVPPAFANDATDRSGVVISAIMVFITFSVLSFCIRVHMKWPRKQPPALDDYTCFSALMLAVILTILTYRATLSGLAKDSALLTTADINSIEKLQYAGTLLAILSLGLSKFSIISFHRSITPRVGQRRTATVLLVGITCWTLGSFLALAAASCDNNLPWDVIGSHCPNLKAIWKGVASMDIATEVCIFINSLWMIWNLKMTLATKASIAVVFALRPTFVGLAAMIHLYYFGRKPDSTDPLHGVIIPFLFFQGEVHFGIMTATMTGLIAWLRSFRFVWGSHASNDDSAYALTTFNKSGSKPKIQRPTGKISRINASLAGDKDIVTQVRAGRSGSQDSSSSRKNIITKTVDIQWQTREPDEIGYDRRRMDF